MSPGKNSFKKYSAIRDCDCFWCQTEILDAVFSYSSLEHSGLGRYGDPLAPYGDAEAVAEMWCSLRPGGLFFLALPSFNDVDRRRRCQIVWNAHRIYGYVRLQVS